MPLNAMDGNLEPAFVSTLNQFLQEEDVFFVRGKPLVLPLIKKITKGKIAIIRQSLEEIENDISFFQSNGVRFDFICYNPEDFKTSHTPQAERLNIVESVKKAKNISKRLGVKLIICPDTKKILPKFGSELAQHADIFAIQFQAWQFLPKDEFRRKVAESVSIIKKGNPSIPIIAQLSTNPPTGKFEKGVGKVYSSISVETLILQVEEIKNLVDGVGFLYSYKDDGLGRLVEFLRKKFPDFKK